MRTLLATKLYTPSPPPKRVPRPHLLRRLDEGLAAGRRITLVSAPAGFGKTTCISEWVATLDGWPVSWLSLDPADDDPGRFLAYLIAALQEIDPQVGREIEGILRAGQLPPAEAISTALCNDILEVEGRFLLVLDDLQAIQDEAILHVLEALVTNLPQPLHLALLTREDPPLPLARLRANNQLTEIRARHLRFSRDDAGRFMNDVMGLSLSPADIAELETKTEGWAAGLQLAGLSVRDRADPSAFIAGLSGSHRFIVSYLSEEVLSRQPADVERFLLQTSILDELNGELCRQVTGRPDSEALLDRLFDANLFVVPLDERREWYRYHHLFADLLRDLQARLDPAETAELHRRASRWYAGEGRARQAIEHALAAQDYAGAVDLLESHATGMIMKGYARTVHGWVQAIPAGWRSQSPRTNLAFAWMHLLRGDYAGFARYMERLSAGARAGGSQPGKRSLRAEWLVMRCLLLNMEGDTAASLAAAREALEIAPAEDHRVRSLVYFGLACAYQATDEDTDRVVDAYQRAIQLGREADNSIAVMLSTSGLAQLALEHGQLTLATQIAEPVVARIERSGSLPPISTVVFGILAEVQYHWCQVDEARRHARRALQLSTLGGYQSGLIGCRILLSRLAQLEGDLESAAREIEPAIELLLAAGPAYTRQEAVAQQVRVHLARDHAAAAEMVLQGHGFSFGERISFPGLAEGGKVAHSPGLLYNSGLRLLLYQARATGDLTGLQAGLELADRLVDGTLRGRYLPVALEALLHRAQLHAMLGNGPASEADYRHALELAEPEGFIGVFVEAGPPVAAGLANLARRDDLGAVQPDTIRRVLAACSAPRPAAAPLVEPLTDRELDVLRLMAEGLKYKEIAARLFVSLNTVRYHVKALYGKLGANNRTQAVATARQRGLLP
jgi:LuxR family maltose regulon positive regulatory protein